VAGAVALVVFAGVVAAVTQNDGHDGLHQRRATTAVRRPEAPIPAVEAGLLPWQLPQSLSREVLLPGPGRSLTILGGLSAGRSTTGIFSLDTATGSLNSLGSLSVGTHDAAGAQIGGWDLVIGGGSPTTNANVQALATTSARSRRLQGRVVAELGRPRSDSSAVSIGHTVYVVGGYDGRDPDSAVLATTDGRHFSVVAHIRVPVRYAATATLGDSIYLFGGEAASGAHAGAPLDTIQMVQPATKTATIVGRLPEPLAGAAAAVLDGHLYVAGGVASAARTPRGNAGVGVGQGPRATTGAIFAYDPATRRLLRAGTLPEPVAFGAVQVVGRRAWLVGGENGGTPVSSVEMFTPNRRFGTAGAAGAGSPFFGGKLLIADRGNNRLLLIDDSNEIVWTYPSNYAAAPPGGFYFPDDAFFAKHGTEIISNEEQNETVVIIAFPSGRILWHYGHPRQPGTARGYLHEPDDAYVLKNGKVLVADAQACRVLIINRNKTVAKQIGTDNVCTHQPPNYIGTPNGDTPLANGNILVSEINGAWITEYRRTGHTAWTVHLDIHYPSDPQRLGPDRYLVCDYAHPGAILEFNRAGKILYRYRPTSGPGELNQPSLAELLPSGVFMSNDDYRDRMVAIDPTTRALIWQYGVSDTPGTAAGRLNIPDGFDLLMPGGATPTHPATG
jgi:N-acetylneuraminic acid mutarotase